MPECISNIPRPGVVYRPLAEPAPIADVRMIYRRDHSAVAERFVRMAREFATASVVAFLVNGAVEAAVPDGGASTTNS